MSSTNTYLNWVSSAPTWVLMASLSHANPLPPPIFAKVSPITTPNTSLLADETFQRGIFNQHLQQSHGLHGLDDTLGSGLCVFDMDNDGDLDVYFVSGSGATRFYGKKQWWSEQPQSQLYQNDGNGHFSLLNSDTGLPSSLWGMGCNSADLDSDGFEDLILTHRGENWIAYGNGQGAFTSVKLGTTSHWSTSSSLVDINNDGLLDIYIGNYIRFQKNTKTFENNSGFTQDDTAFSPQNFPAQANQLYLNSGKRKFTEQTQDYNLANADGRTLGAQWLDANHDEWADLLVINDKGSEPQLFINQSGESFTRAPLQQQIDSPDGLRNITTLTLQGHSSQAISAYTSGLGFAPYLLYTSKDKHSNLTWDKILGPDKLEGLSHWGIAHGDFNGDGLDDLYLGAGFLHPDSDAHRLPQGQPDTLLLQTEAGTLHKQANVFNEGLSTRAVISADIDNDGDSDLLLTHNNGPAQLKINYSNPTYWIGLDIRNQFGQRNQYKNIKLKQKNTSIKLPPISDGFLSNSDLRHHPALKYIDNVHVTIQWLDGSKSEYSDLPTNLYHRLSKGKNSQVQAMQKSSEKDATPLALLFWQIKARQVNWQGALHAFSKASSSSKSSLLDEANKTNNQPLLLAFIEIALNQNIKLDNLAQVLQMQELEMSLPLILRLISKGPDCKTAKMIQTWFDQEEAMLVSKPLFTRPLMQQLKSATSSQKQCILYALAESRQFRPVIAIENILTNNKEHGVQKAALFSLGELRRSRSINVIKPFLNDPLLEKYSRAALQKLQGQHTTSISPSISLQQESSASTVIDNNKTPCPRMDIGTLLLLSHQQQANLFNLCSLSSLQAWLNKYSTQLTNSIKMILYNPQLSSFQFSLVLQNIKTDRLKSFDLLLLGLLSSTEDPSKKMAIIKAMHPYGDLKPIQMASENIFVNRKYPKALRIAAGDLLIDHKPALVMKHSGSIFNE
jgi:hypothetical protein